MSIRGALRPRFRPFVARILPRAAHLARDEAGGMLVWSLFTLLGVLLAVGLGIDVMRTETVRSHMQNTLDRAVLAAADLEQDRTAEEVVRDYFTRSGLPGEKVNVDDTGSGINQKIVGASLTANVGTVFLDMIGFDSLPAPTAGQAIESVTDVEVALVLDNSGSMGWNGNYRLNLLKPAAREFIDTVVKPVPDGEPGLVSVSIVPFSTQVNAGPLLGGALNFSGEHDYSQCADFADDTFEDTAISPVTPLQRAGHFDISTYDSPVDTYGVVCPYEASRQITPWSRDTDALKAQIDGMWADGNTSIDVATKWGVALLDPAMRPVLTQLESEDKIDERLLGRPYDHDRENTLKVLVVMSDGENTTEFRLRDPYRSGASPVWRDPDTGIVSYHDEDSGQYFVFNAANLFSRPGGSWQAEPAGGADAVNYSWPDLWDAMSVAHYARLVKAEAIGGSWNAYYNEIYDSVGPATKNPRTSQICQAARDAGIVVYTIGMDTYGQGDATLEECAGTTVNFFDVEATDIGVAFSAIARQINQLRLTQ